MHSTMTHEGLVLYALLAGGDYDKVCRNCYSHHVAVLIRCLQGLEHCGKSTALGVVKHGLGAELHAATSSVDVEASLVAWRKHLREVLVSDPEGIAGGRRPAAANNIEDTFPNQEVLDAYTRPLCSAAKGPGPSSPLLTLPDLPRIAKLCGQYFEWATRTISRKLSVHVWPGAVLRMVLADISASDALPVRSLINSPMSLY